MPTEEEKHCHNNEWGTFGRCRSKWSEQRAVVIA
jgi:hypothetical protein